MEALSVLVGIGWFAGCFLAGWVANEKARNPMWWFFISFFMSPLLALLALTAIPALQPWHERLRSRPARYSELEERLAGTYDKKD